MTVPWYVWVALGVAALAVIVFAGLAQVQAWRNQRAAAKEAAALATLAKGADNPEVDEDFAKTLLAAGEQ